MRWLLIAARLERASIDYSKVQILIRNLFRCTNGSYMFTLDPLVYYSTLHFLLEAQPLRSYSLSLQYVLATGANI